MSGEKTRAALIKAAGGANLSGAESAEVFGEIMSGEVEPQILAAFLTALKMKGETVEEVVGAARAMRARAAYISAGNSRPVDIVGTAADGLRHLQHIHDFRFHNSGRGDSRGEARQPRPPRANAVPATCWRRWGSTSTSTRPLWSTACRRRE